MTRYFSKSISALLLLLSLASCQRAWVASPNLETTDVPVEKTIVPDPELEARIAPYREQVTEKMAEIIGRAPVELGTADYQSPLGNFVVDLMLAQARERYEGEIDMATTTNGGLRIPIPMGYVEMGTIFELMPFENELVVLTLDGHTVKAFFDVAAEAKYAPVANATYTVKDGKAMDIRIGEEPLKLDQNYTLVTSDYLAGGGDNLSMFKNALKTEKVGLMMRDAIIEQIRELTAKGQAIGADTTMRVTVLP
ncbi:5'-nucleotidase-like protein [Pontibacter ummariensis]|uniref:5'-nucleotidase, C-terminal domain n=1 Tax=Pontibacter ummariensis TaxID=1610492 RepID=A0A239E5H8_9BACT|nr:5'-nucleotidase C-terminal domain-containing protein [Pontibacter ummariensis]PRY13092.1 5'-nucleotidase-like protein [Pontibacter ummariensis]SNS39887.1 5'-nucleotidase, C-terminal domain [Pontibacter ummariensis]